MNTVLRQRLAKLTYDLIMDHELILPVEQSYMNRLRFRYKGEPIDDEYAVAGNGVFCNFERIEGGESSDSWIMVGPLDNLEWILHTYLNFNIEDNDNYTRLCLANFNINGDKNNDNPIRDNGSHPGQRW